MSITKNFFQYLTVIMTIAFFSCCSSDPIFLKNGLTKSASKVTTYILKESKTEQKYDTIANRIKLFDLDDKMQSLSISVGNESTLITNIYENENIIKQVITNSQDNSSNELHYFYTLNRIDSIVANSEVENYLFDQKFLYNYSNDTILVNEIHTSLTLDSKTKEVITNITNITTFNPDKTKKTLSIIDHKNSTKSSELEYFYKNGEITKTIENINGKVITTLFKYKFDQHKNWIFKEAIKNGKSYTLYSRQIEYR